MSPRGKLIITIRKHTPCMTVCTQSVGNVN
jgi:hypothetical protein